MIKLISALLLVVLLFPACGPKEKPRINPEPELLRLNNLYDSALIHHDTAILKKLYHDDFVYTNPDGKLLTRNEQIISNITSEMKWESGKSDDLKVKVFGDAAVMTGSFHATGTYRSNPVTINERYTAVWIKYDTTWQMIAEQGNVIK